ncbi:MAG: hypothetical protein Q7T18_11480 [Sedimentisphaerales bacterium]|nr:hypothetical protein [Sedimentisphaerales bacterium]
MKTNKLLIIVATIVIIASIMPTMAFAGGHGGGHGRGHGGGHSNWSIGIGIGFPAYGGYGYWGNPYYYPYYPPVVYAPPPYYPPVVVVAPPVVAVPPVVVRGDTPPIAVIRDDAITSYVNVPNSNGSITPVRIRRLGNVWVGPKGEQYLSYPTVEQLKPVYGF